MWRRDECGDAMNGDAMNGDAMNGDAMNGDAMNGDAMNGDAMNGDAMNRVSTCCDMQDSGMFAKIIISFVNMKLFCFFSVLKQRNQPIKH